MHTLKFCQHSPHKGLDLQEIMLPDQINIPSDSSQETIDALICLLHTIKSKYSEFNYFWSGFHLIANQLTADHVPPSTHLVASMYAYCMGNPESAAFFASQASSHNAIYSLAQTLLYNFHANLHAEESVEEYQALAKKGIEACMIHYLSLARTYFKSCHFAKADHYIQRASGLNLTLDPMTPEIKQLLPLFFAEVKASSLTEVIENWETFRDKQHGATESGTNRFWDEAWSNCPNKKRLCKLIVEKIASMEQPNITYLELGCHMGTLMNMVNESCKSQDIAVDVLGIEPDQTVLGQAKLKLPELQFFSGNHERLLSISDITSNPIDVFVLSQVCLLMRPEWVEQTFDFAKTKCRYIFILEDLSNSLGPQSVPRRFYQLHPYHHLLEKFGFDVEQCEMTPKPNVSINGILVAKSRHL